MRINKYLALATGMSRRAADTAVANGRVLVNGGSPTPGLSVEPGDDIKLDGQPVKKPASDTHKTMLLNKPAGYVCSRNGQGNKTIYDLLPPELHHLKPVGRLDKESSGLLLLTTDGDLANRLTHPRYQKTKVYKVRLDKPLAAADHEAITRGGVSLGDGPSRFALKPTTPGRADWQVTMQEGRNRQIRRTFAALGYTVTRLHRTHFGPYRLDNLPGGAWRLTRLRKQDTQ
jgi:23S rRNA pseudouridine2605 synthase